MPIVMSQVTAETPEVENCGSVNTRGRVGRMDRERCWWAIATVLGLQAAIAPSTVAQSSFLAPTRWTTPLMEAMQRPFATLALDDTMYSSQRQVNTLTIDAADLADSHWLILETAANLTGQIEVDGVAIAILATGRTEVDIRPYLIGKDDVQVRIMGTYAPRNASLRLQFEGPGISVNQQTAGVGRLNYELNLLIR